MVQARRIPMLTKLRPVLLASVGIAISGATSYADNPNSQGREMAVSLDGLKWSSCGVPEFPGCEVAVLYGDPTKGASAYLVRIPAGGAFPKHWHTNSHDFVGVKGTLVFNFKDGRQMTLRPGTFGFWPGGEQMEGRCSNEEPCVYYDHQDKFADVHVLAEGAPAEGHHTGTTTGAPAAGGKQQ